MPYLWYGKFAGPYGPSTATARLFIFFDIVSSMDCTLLYREFVHGPWHLITRESLSSSIWELEVMLNGCHWIFEILGILINNVLMGEYCIPAVIPNHKLHKYYILCLLILSVIRFISSHGSFGSVSSTALHGSIRAEIRQVVLLDCMMRKILSRAKRRTPENTKKKCPVPACSKKKMMKTT